MAPRSARAAVLVGPRALEIREIGLPEISDDDGLLRVEACGLCGTDHEQFTGTMPAPVPFIPGHESVGVIEEVGDAAAERWGVKRGDRVALEVYQSCRECDACRRGDYRNCIRHGLRDTYGFTGLKKPPQLWGGYAEYQYLAPDAILHRVPDSLAPEIATLFNPLGAGVRWGRELPGTSSGDVVVVMGPGIRGLSCIAAARDAGAAFVMVTGLGPGDARRLEIATGAFGADVAVDVATSNPADVLKSATGGLADVVVDVTARAPAALAQGISLTRPGGTLVIAGIRGSAETPGFWPDMIAYKELTIIGALGVDTEAYAEALRLLDSGRYGFEDLPRTSVPLDGASDLLALMAGERDGEAPVHGVVTPWARD